MGTGVVGPSLTLLCPPPLSFSVPAGRDLPTGPTSARVLGACQECQQKTQGWGCCWFREDHVAPPAGLSHLIVVGQALTGLGGWVKVQEQARLPRAIEGENNIDLIK